MSDGEMLQQDLVGHSSVSEAGGLTLRTVTLTPRSFTIPAPSKPTTKGQSPGAGVPDGFALSFCASTGLTPIALTCGDACRLLHTQGNFQFSTGRMEQ